MILKIKNVNRLVGVQFWNGIFVFTAAHETDTNYRFQFKDTRSNSLRVVWVEVSKIGHYNRIEQEWEYILNYPNLKGGTHTVTAKWFEDWQNVMETFGMALKKSIN
jgi:hypothetical protein